MSLAIARSTTDTQAQADEWPLLLLGEFWVLSDLGKAGHALLLGEAFKATAIGAVHQEAVQLLRGRVLTAARCLHVHVGHEHIQPCAKYHIGRLPLRSTAINFNSRLWPDPSPVWSPASLPNSALFIHIDEGCTHQRDQCHSGYDDEALQAHIN